MMHGFRIGYPVVHVKQGWGGTVTAMDGENIRVQADRGDAGRPLWYHADEFQHRLAGIPIAEYDPARPIVPDQTRHRTLSPEEAYRRRPTPEERYQTDAQFKTLVDTLFYQIQHCNYTGTEIREAAMLAAILHERRRPAGMFVGADWGKTQMDDVRRAAAGRVGEIITEHIAGKESGDHATEERGTHGGGQPKSGG